MGLDPQQGVEFERGGYDKFSGEVISYKLVVDCKPKVAWLTGLPEKESSRWRLQDGRQGLRWC